VDNNEGPYLAGAISMRFAAGRDQRGSLYELQFASVSVVLVAEICPRRGLKHLHSKLITACVIGMRPVVGFISAAIVCSEAVLSSSREFPRHVSDNLQAVPPARLAIKLRIG